MTQEKQITVISDNLGPAMSALNERQRAFVVAMFDLGPKGTYAEAARQAGYPDNDTGYIRLAAHRMAHNEKVQAALREEAGRRATGLLPLANAMMHNIMSDPAHPDHLKALKHMQAIGGLQPVAKIEVVHKNDAASLKADLLAAIDLLKSVSPATIDVTPVEIDNHSQEFQP